MAHRSKGTPVSMSTNTVYFSACDNTEKRQIQTPHMQTATNCNSPDASVNTPFDQLVLPHKSALLEPQSQCDLPSASIKSSQVNGKE